ncbi:MAG: hypothetical protein P8X70_02935 [Nanoarchaeota archaeon]
MAKKSSKETSSKKPKKITDQNIEKVLVENFVSLQKVITNLSLKFNDLTKQLSKLLELFEVSAKTLAEKEAEAEKGSNKKVIEQIDKLLEQNKLIARGISLMHENMQDETQENFPQQQRPPTRNLQAPSPKHQIKAPSNNQMQGYQKSISSKVVESPATQLPGKENAKQ